MKTKHFLATLCVAATILTVYSCKKETAPTLDTTDNTYIKNINFAAKAFDDTDPMAEEAYQSGEVTFQGMTLPSNSNELNPVMDKAGCATITRDTVNRILTIDFGTVNCLCQDGKTRRGKITIQHSGPFMATGTTRTFNYTNYFINDNQITGSRVVTNMGLNANNQLYFQIVVQGAVIMANGNGTLTYSAQRTRTWIAGAGTPIKTDNVHEITGSSSGTFPNGETFTANITSPLIKKFEIGCREVVKGIWVMNRSTRPTKTIDYGNGTCDNEATVTVGNNTHIINLN